MKIGLICPYHLSKPGGVQRQVLEWSHELQALGHDCVILTCGPEVKLNSGNIVFFGNHLPIHSNKDMSTLSIYPKNGKALKDYLRRENFDLLHFHEPLMPFLPWQILSASETVNVATRHAFSEASLFLKIFGKSAKSLYLSYLMRKIKNHSAVSRPATHFIKDLATEIEIIPNAVDLSRFQGNEKIYKFSDGRINLLYVGRLTMRKGILYLLEAVRRLNRKFNNFRLVVVGSGPLKKRIQKYIKRHQLKNVILEGHVQEEKLASYFCMADIFCAPAPYAESFGVVLLEAMASSLPIVAFSNAGYKEVLKEKPFCDFLVEPGNVEGFCSSLERLITHKDLRSRVGELGLQEAQRYSWQHVKEKILSFYHKALNDSG